MNQRSLALQLGAVLLACLLVIPPAQALPPELNFDGDALSEVVAVTPTGASKILAWSSLSSASTFATASDLGSFGTLGDNLISGNWLSGDAANVGVVHRNKSTNQVIWKILTDSGSEEELLGTGDMLLVSGGDYNGNGFGDGAAVNKNGRVTIMTDLFLPTVANRSLRFPRRVVAQGKGLFATPDGVTDYLGFVQRRDSSNAEARYMLYLRGLDGVTIRTFSGGPGLKRGRYFQALPVAKPAGDDAVLYHSRSSSTTFLTLRDLDGTELYRGEVSGRGIVVIGDYLSSPGEEIGVELNDQLVVINPFDQSQTTIDLNGGILVDHINVHSFKRFTSGRPSGGGGGGGGGAGDDDDDGGTGGGVTPTNPGLAQVCRSVRELQRCEIWKSIASDHITDARRNSTSYITTRGCSGFYDQCIEIYDSRGNSVHSLGQYFPTGSEYDNRHYGCFGCGDCKSASSVAGIARANTGSSSVYVKDSSGTCIRVPDASRCYNSSGC